MKCGGPKSCSNRGRDDRLHTPTSVKFSAKLFSRCSGENLPRRPGWEKLLVRDGASLSRCQVLELVDFCVGQSVAGLKLADGGILFAAVILWPKFTVERRAIGREHDAYLFHALHQDAAPDDLIIRMRYNHEGVFHQRSQSSHYRVGWPFPPMGLRQRPQRNLSPKIYFRFSCTSSNSGLKH